MTAKQHKKERAPLVFVKAVGKLMPVDDIAEDALSKIKYGEEVVIEIKKPKNIKLLRKFWALVTIVYNNQDRYKTRENVAEALKLSTGTYHMIELPGGHIYRIPDSIAEMEDVEFTQFFDRVCDVIAEHYLPGVTVAWLRQEVESLVGISR